VKRLMTANTFKLRSLLPRKLSLRNIAWKALKPGTKEQDSVANMESGSDWKSAVSFHSNRVLGGAPGAKTSDAV